MYWEVPFPVVLARLVAPLRADLPTSLLDDIGSSATGEDLTLRLEDHGISARCDPSEAFLGPNRSRASMVLFALLDTAVAWRHRAGEAPGVFLERDRFAEEVADRLSDGLGFKRTLDDAELYLLACDVVPHEAEHGGFWQAAGAVDGVAALRTRLAIADEQIQAAESAAAAATEQARRKAREVTLCGAAFEGATDAFSSIWSFFDDGPGVRSLGGLEVDLDTLAPLLEPAESKPRAAPRSRKGAASPKGEPRMTDDQKRVVGFAGEALAFKFLRARYGESRVPATAWVSSGAEVVTGTSVDTDDHLGYDFHIVDDSAQSGVREYFIEVKASLGDRCEFTLGSSQVRKAAEVAGDPTKRFLVLHITSLATTPRPRLLPNPFEPGSERLYEMRGDGQRVAYLADEQG